MKKLEYLLVTLPLILNGCTFSIKNENYNEYVKEQISYSNYQKIDNKCEPIVFSPIIILEFSKKTEDKKYQ